jgi:hypothetical protein
MWKSMGLAAAMAVFAAMPARAQSDSCGDEPIPPAIPTAAEIGQDSPDSAQKAKHNAFHDIRAWQAQLKGYRDCLDAATATAKREKQDAMSSSKPDKTKIAEIQARLDAADKAYQHTTDTEEHLVNDFHALSTAYCSRADVDKTSCPKT